MSHQQNVAFILTETHVKKTFNHTMPKYCVKSLGLASPYTFNNARFEKIEQCFRD